MATGGNSSSRLGLRSTEDPGRRPRAGFWLESGLSIDNGTTSGFKFDRRSTVS